MGSASFAEGEWLLGKQSKVDGEKGEHRRGMYLEILRM